MFGLSVNGFEIMVGVVGLILLIEIDVNKVFVCDNGCDCEFSFFK